MVVASAGKSMARARAGRRERWRQRHMSVRKRAPKIEKRRAYDKEKERLNADTILECHVRR